MGQLHHHRLRRHRGPGKAMDPNTKLSCLSNHFNIILYIDHKLQESPIRWFWRHVRVNQDNHLVPLDRWDSLKVTCDTAAKHWWTTHQKNRLSMHQNRFIQGEIWCLFTDSPIYPTSGKWILYLGKKISTNMRERMEESIFGPPIIVRWHKIGNLNKEIHHLLDCKALKGASESSTNYQRRWATWITSQ